MSLMPARWRRPRPTPAPESTHARLEAPTGTEVWICQTPLEGKTAHNHRWQADNRAATRGGLVYPAVVETEETLP